MTKSADADEAQDVDEAHVADDHPAAADSDAAAPARPPPEPKVAPEDEPRRRHGVRLIAIGLFAVAVLLSVVLAKTLNPSQRVDSPLIGHPAPPFVLSLLDGTGTLDSATLRGNVTVVNFWASWCIPCRKEAPILESFANRWEPSGVRLVGILFNDTVAKGLAFRDEFHLTYTQVDDPTGQVSVSYGVTGVPETYIIDPNGFVVAKIVGAVSPTTLDDVFAELAAGRTVDTRGGAHQPSPPSTAGP